jgi:hypothetical protein
MPGENEENGVRKRQRSSPSLASTQGKAPKKATKEKGSRPFQTGIPEFYRRVGTPMTLGWNYPVHPQSSSVGAVAFLRLD